MTWWLIGILLLTGVVAGTASGFIGIGGGFIMAPVQYWVLTTIGIDPDVAIKVAFGTNLLVIIPTAMSSAFSHHKNGSVLWKAGLLLGLSGAFGGIVGSSLAVHLPATTLKIIFGFVVLLGAVRMIGYNPEAVESEPKLDTKLLLLVGFPVGVISGVVGVGGGALVVPIMVMLLRFKMHQAVGTSSAQMMFTAMGGASAYLIHGIGVQGLPPYSIGYINLLQFVLLAGASVPMAKVGAKIAHKVPARQLKFVFCIVFIYMGLKMIGVFSWLNLPL